MIKKRNKMNPFKKGVFILFCLFALFITLFAVLYDKRLLPVVVEITKLKSETAINKIISETVYKIVDEDKLSFEDFYLSSTLDGKIQSITVNSLLVDRLCSRIAADISSELSNLKKERVEVPLGVMTGINAFSNLGPSYSIKIQPLGSATVDYTSSFESAGINQINFQIWLQVETKMLIINPLQRLEINVSRSVLLVNVAFSGDVPNWHFR